MGWGVVVVILTFTRNCFYLAIADIAPLIIFYL